MILGLKEHASRYAVFSAAFSEAMSFIASGELDVLASYAPDDYHVFKMKDMFVRVQHYDTKASSKFESHVKFADVQYIFSGEESMDVTDLSLVGDVVDKYSPLKDIAFYADPRAGTCPIQHLALRHGMFAIFFPEDAHKPCLMTGGTVSRVTKLLIKVPI